MTAEDVIEVVCEEFGITISEFYGGRYGKVSAARVVATKVMRSEARMSYPEIARAMRRRSHSSLHRQAEKIASCPVMLELVAARAKARWRRRQAAESGPRWAKPPVNARLLIYILRRLDHAA